jgi:hypothetical protein
MDRADAVVNVTRSEGGQELRVVPTDAAPIVGCVQQREQGVGGLRNPVAGRAYRPVLVADVTALIDAVGGANTLSREEVADATATAVISAGAARSSDCAHRLVTLADVVGLDTLAALWSDADPVSLRAPCGRYTCSGSGANASLTRYAGCGGRERRVPPLTR